ncbi:TPA: hypothetical protein ACSP17_003294, partial [Aeromonas hydrophila]
MRTSHLAPILLASLLLNLWQWQADPVKPQPGTDTASPANSPSQCDSATSQSSGQSTGQSTGQSLLAKLPGKGSQSEPTPAQEVLPPNPELEAAISQWSQSSEGSVLIERL